MIETDAWRRVKIQKNLIDMTKSVSVIEIFLQRLWSGCFGQHAAGNKQGRQRRCLELSGQGFDKILAASRRFTAVPPDLDRSRVFEKIPVQLSYSVLRESGAALDGLGSRFVPDHTDSQIKTLSLAKIAFLSYFHKKTLTVLF
jgi:hypothetical protein